MTSSKDSHPTCLETLKPNEQVTGGNVSLVLMLLLVLLSVLEKQR